MTLASFEQQSDAELFGAAGAGFNFGDFVDESACAPSATEHFDSPMTDSPFSVSVPMSSTGSTDSGHSSSPTTLASVSSAFDASPLFGVDSSPFETLTGLDSLCGPSPASFANAFNQPKAVTASTAGSPPVVESTIGFDPSVLVAFSPATSESALPEQTKSGKLSKKRVYTGTRNTTIPPIAMNAPAMHKVYAVPSATSRKALPAKQAKKLAERLASVAAASSPAPEVAPPAKRARGRPRKTTSPDVDAAAESLAAFANGDADLPEDMAAEIEANRKRNREAARESRARKAAAMQNLQDEVDRLKAERDAAAKAFEDMAERNARLEDEVRRLRGF